MALVRLDGSDALGNYNRPPVTQSLARPPNFNDVFLARSLAFDSQPIRYPRGSRDNPKAVLQEGPIPLESSIGGSTSLRQTFFGFQSACGITFLDSTVQPHVQVRLFAKAIIAELEDSKTQKPGAAGPHETIPSRACAVTLLLPKGTTVGAVPDTNIVDGLACLVAAGSVRKTNRKNNSGMASGPSFASSEATVATMSMSLYEPALAASNNCIDWSVPKRCRVGVLCGEADVAGFLDAGNVSLNDFKSQSAIFFSFVKQDNTIGQLYVPLEMNASQSTDQAIREISKAAHAAQLQSGKCLVLPAQFLCPDESSIDYGFDFISLQADVRSAFHQFYLAAPKIAVPADVLDTLDARVESVENHFVRVVPQPQPSAPFAQADPNHSIGVMINSDEAIYNDFVARCRAAVKFDPMAGEWPIFGLQPEIDEEVDAHTSVLWWKGEVKYFGMHLSLFAPRQQLGAAVTQIKNSHVAVLTCRLDPLLALFRTGFMLLPCDGESVRPGHVLEKPTYLSFAKNMTTSLEYVSTAQTNGYNQTTTNEAPPALGLTAHDLETNLKLNLALGLEVHTGTTTCGDLYALVDANNTETQTTSNLHAFATNAIRHHATEAPLGYLFDVCAEMLGDTILFRQVEGRMKRRLAAEAERHQPSSSSPRDPKRRQLSTGSGSSSEVRVPDGLHLFETPGGRFRLFALVGLQLQSDWCTTLTEEIETAGCEDMFTITSSVLGKDDDVDYDDQIVKERTWPEQLLTTLNTIYATEDDAKTKILPLIHVLISDGENTSCTLFRYNLMQRALLPTSLVSFLDKFDGRRVLFAVTEDGLTPYASAEA